MEKPTIPQLFKVKKSPYITCDRPVPPGWASVAEMLKRKYRKRPGYHICKFTVKDRVSRAFGNDLPEIKEGRILDMGCSEGETTTEISGLYPGSQVIGIDLIPPLYGHYELFWNREDAKGTYLVADGFEPPFPDESFDAVFCMNNIYHEVIRLEAREECKEGYKAISRLIKPDGYLLISGTERRYGGNGSVEIIVNFLCKTRFDKKSRFSLSIDS